MRKRRIRAPKKKNEKACGKALRELLDIEIVEQYRIKEKIMDGTEIIRNYTLIDFEFKINGKQYLVEYNGQSHFKTIKRWFWDKDKLRKQKFRDEWLKSYCAANTIELINIDGRKVRGKQIKIFLQDRLSHLI